MMSGSASWMMRRTSARVSARQPPRDRIRSSMRREAAFPVARFASAPGLAFALPSAGTWTWWPTCVACLRATVPLAFGSLLFGFSATVHSPTCCDAQRPADQRRAEPGRCIGRLGATPVLGDELANGGHEVNGNLHRSVCRRLERCLVLGDRLLITLR